MVGPMGVLPVSLVPTTTEVGDVDGGPPGGAFGIFGSGHHRSWRRRWWQRPPLKLEMSMAAHLGGAAGISGSGHH
jgi:hypothetical protein